MVLEDSRPRKQQKQVDKVIATHPYHPYILWMEEILHQLIGGLSHYL